MYILDYEKLKLALELLEQDKELNLFRCGSLSLRYRRGDKSFLIENEYYNDKYGFHIITVDGKEVKFGKGGYIDYLMKVKKAILKLNKG